MVTYVLYYFGVHTHLFLFNLIKILKILYYYYCCMFGKLHTDRWHTIIEQLDDTIILWLFNAFKAQTVHQTLFAYYNSHIVAAE